MRPPLITEPQSVPLDGRDAHLPAVARERLTAEALRRRFVDPPVWTPEFSGDGGRLSDRPMARAAVLLALVQREVGLTVLLTRRTSHLRAHAGQISFPGGRCEPEDPDAAATALREAAEEVGLAASWIDVLGVLPDYTTVTAFQVTPVVALVRPGFDLQLDAHEVAEAFEVPLAFLMNPAHHQRHRFDYDGGSRHFYAMPWQGESAQTATPPYFIWGATAAMLRNFYRFLSA